MNKEFNIYSVFSILMLSMVLIGCGDGCNGPADIIVPDSDDTPPTVKLGLILGADGSELHEDGEIPYIIDNFGEEYTYEVDIDDWFVIVVAGFDEDGGVKRVWIEGSVSGSCTYHDNGMRRYATISFPIEREEKVVDADPGDPVRPRLFHGLEFRCWDMVSRAGGSYYRPGIDELNYIASYTGHAENFHGLVVSTPPIHLVYYSSID